eukprot:CAMPEP_0119548440 /NCGR_PEP_ID=MMETSP1352-20130426/2375_1 /TAXON_ID=265584 /ORGANISM="Stauroneis constricta, Strain CCMP1120" /LENGTH=382 /DNA_ID=CAMNT_0007593723 /DNA_START=45 /DNA_END=1193 /DNA_ORIENTATION=-
MSNLAKAAVGALALNGGADPQQQQNDVAKKVETPTVDRCPVKPRTKFHQPDACLAKPMPVHDESHERYAIYQRMMNDATGATLVPNQKTVFCPREVQSLHNPSAMKGFDTTWIVENTASTPIVLAWVVDGKEWSPFHPDKAPMEDPEAILQPGDWSAVPAFESFVYQAREITEDGPGRVLVQHRAGLIPLGNPNDVHCDASLPDVEPLNPKTGNRKKEWKRTPVAQQRKCNIMDIGFRNQLGCPLHVYWAGSLEDVPSEGWTCGEQFKFHLGTKPATQNFMHDWESSTKFEASFISHTYVARLASDPTKVVDSYTLRPTQVPDCPDLKEQSIGISEKQEEVTIEAAGDIRHDHGEQDASIAAAAAMASLHNGGGGASVNSLH